MVPREGQEGARAVLDLLLALVLLYEAAAPTVASPGAVSCRRAVRRNFGAPQGSASLLPEAVRSRPFFVDGDLPGRWFRRAGRGARRRAQLHNRSPRSAFTAISPDTAAPKQSSPPRPYAEPAEEQQPLTGGDRDAGERRQQLRDSL